MPIEDKMLARKKGPPHRLFSFALIVASALLARCPTYAQCNVLESDKLTESDPELGIGPYVSVDGDVAIVSAGGLVNVYRFIPGAPGQWIQEAQLTASDAAPNDSFGGPLSVSGDVAIVGAQGPCPGGGSCGWVYVYRFNSGAPGEWIEEQKLTAPDAAARYSFGHSLSVSGDVAVVGSRFDDIGSVEDCGSAYIFRFNGSTWVQEAKLTAFDRAEDDHFGSVSVSGDVVAVGASGDNCVVGSDCGSVYIFRFNGSSWVQEAKLTASDAMPNDFFGSPVAVSGDLAVVGAVFDDDCAAGAGANCGSAHVFRFNGSTWVHETKLTASHAAPTDYFGDSVSISGEMVVVGAPYGNCDAGAGFDCGSAFVYRPNGSTWVQVAKLTASDAEEFDLFGREVSISGDVAFVGGDNCGAVYIFQLGDLPLPIPDCNANMVPDECDIADGTSLDGNKNGKPDECDTDLPAFISAQPVSVVACENETVVFTVVAGGMPPLNYQWRKDTVELSGENTDTLMLPGFTSADLGDYDVIVTNDLGSIVSNQVSLTLAMMGDILPDPTGIAKNRFISLSIPEEVVGCALAIRVTLVSLHHVVPPYTGGLSIPFTAFEGEVRWVGPLAQYRESGSNPTMFWAASLQCTPHYQQWGAVGLVHVTGSAVVPSSVYDVQAFDISCQGTEETCTDVSNVIRMLTARWGDVETPYNPPSSTTQPDLGDIAALLRRFTSIGAPIKARALLVGSDAFGNISTTMMSQDVSFAHIAACVDAFRGKPYPHMIQSCP